MTSRGRILVELVRNKTRENLNNDKIPTKHHLLMSSFRSPVGEEQKELTKTTENVIEMLSGSGDIFVSNNEFEMSESLLPDTDQGSEIDDSDADPTYELPAADNLRHHPVYEPGFDEDQGFSATNIIVDVPMEQVNENANENQKELNTVINESSYKRHTGLLKVCSCKFKCYEKVHLFNRQIILNNFKSYDFAQRRMFLDKYIVETKVKRRSNQTITQVRNRTLIYKFPNIDPNEDNVIVCKKMFLATLGTRSDGIITYHLKSKQEKRTVDLEDKRALAANKKKKLDTMEIDAKIIAHIESFNPVASHYKLTHAPNRRYLPQDINVRFLHRDFCSTTTEKIGYDKYRKVFVKQNIGSTVPSQDKCPVCSTYEQHCVENNIMPISSSAIIENAIGTPDESLPGIEKMVDQFQTSTAVLSALELRAVIQNTDNQMTGTDSYISTDPAPHVDKTNNGFESNNVTHSSMAAEVAKVLHIENDCITCQRYKSHKIRYIDARKAYTSDSGKEYPANCNVFITADMQKIFIVPKMTIKNSYFVSRLIVMNETFAPLHKGTNICVLWHEGIRGRNAADVTSAYYQIIRRARPEVDNFIFWADNCSAQNKNWTLFSSLVSIVNQEWGPKSITIKYFEPGHSFMKADAVHGRIGAEWKKRAEILDMADVIDVIRKADQNNDVIYLQAAEDFRQFCDGSKIRRKNMKNNYIIPLLDTVRIAEFRKGSRNMFYKEKLDDVSPYKISFFLKDKFQTNIPPPMECNLGVNTAKLDKIKKELLPHMAARKRLFWEEMKTNDCAKDLCTFSAE